MTNRSFYHEGARAMQERFETRPLADRIEQLRLRTSFTEADRELIKACVMFFLATADADGHPDCSYKGGMPGFVKIVDDDTLAFPNYDGNGMYRSLGNILVNPHVGLIFVDFERSKRMRVNGLATIHDDDKLLSEYLGAQLIVRVVAEKIFPNCPRYMHKMKLIEHSVHAPRADHVPPRPEWKDKAEFCDVIPDRGR